MQQVLAVAVGGALGCLCRYGANVACVRWFETPVFYSTLAVNVVGAFLVGLIAGLPFMQHPVLTAGAAVGFLGGLTTFSTFSAEVTELLAQGQYGAGALLAATHLAGSLLLTAAGFATFRALAT